MSEDTCVPQSTPPTTPAPRPSVSPFVEVAKQSAARVLKRVVGNRKEARQIVEEIAERFADEPPLKANLAVIDELLLAGWINAEQAAGLRVETKRKFKCYAAQLSERYNHKPGWPDTFDNPKLFPGRMAKAAALRDLINTLRDDKPWLDLLPRLIFVSDMGDALSRKIEFETLYEEVFRNVISGKGSKHAWLWVTKRPKRMAELAAWLKEKGFDWPANLVAMTTVTSATTLYRVDALRKVPSKMRGLSVEPLWESIKLDLTGIHWVIVGGESGASAEPFHVEWALDLREQCRKAGVAFFFKQLGSKPFFRGKPFKVKDPHGGNWNEWPAEWRVREMPDFVSLVQATAVDANALDKTDADYRASREKVVEESSTAIINAGKALKEIKDYKDGLLWRHEFKSFEDYCYAKWGYRKSHAYRLVECGEFVAQLEEHNQKHATAGEIVTLPVNENQIRAITSIPKENRVTAWVEGVADAPIATLTGKAVTGKVKAFLPAKVPKARPAVVALPVPAEVAVAVKPSPPEHVLETLEASVGEHPKHAEIHALIVQIKALLANPVPEVPAVGAA